MRLSLPFSFGRTRKRADGGAPLPFDQWMSYFAFGGDLYPLMNQTLAGNRETMEGSFGGLTQGALKGSSVVFACMYARMSLFSEARFQFRRLSNGRPGELFGTADLQPLEQPWTNGTTGDLLARAETDVSLAGNFYVAARPGNRLARLRPDWVDIVIGSNDDAELPAYDIDAEVIGYLYWPGGRGSGVEPETLLPEEVAHYAPIPDPEARFRGMSWLTPVIQEILADKQTTRHKRNFFEKGATPNLQVKFDIADPDKFQKWVDKFRENHEGVDNHFKTLFLAAGADATVIGSNLGDIDFTKVQGGGEVRIAAAAGVPAELAGLAISLQGANRNNAENQARRRFGEITMRPLWRNFCGSLAHLIAVPGGAELWYDARDIAFLKDDILQASEALQFQAATVSTLVSAGYEPDSVVAAVVAGDLNLLQHTGLVSVQLLPPGTANHGGAANGRTGVGAPH